MNVLKRFLATRETWAHSSPASLGYPEHNRLPRNRPPRASNSLDDCRQKEHLEMWFSLKQEWRPGKCLYQHLALQQGKDPTLSWLFLVQHRWEKQPWWSLTLTNHVYELPFHGSMIRGARPNPSTPHASFPNSPRIPLDAEKTREERKPSSKLSVNYGPPFENTSRTEEGSVSVQSSSLDLKLQFVLDENIFYH